VAAAALAAAACSASNNPQAAAGTANTAGRGGGTAVPVSTATVEQKAVPLTINVIGTSEPYHTVAVRAQVTGELTAVHFQEGDDVTEGQVIFELDKRPLEAALQQAQANLARDTAQQANAQASAARYLDLFNKGISTREQTDQARTTADALSATVQADKAAVDNAQVQLQYATIKAPISGRTGTLMVHEGNLVRANDTTPLVVINQVSPIFVSFGVPESQLADLKRYMAAGTVKLQATAPNETVSSEGRITFIDNAVDATTGQIKIKGTFPNADHRLWPGQFANVTVTLKNDPNAIVVPAAAVQNSQTGNYVFVVTAGKTAEIRNITLDRQTSDLAIIKDGLKPGEVVVTDGQIRLVGGSKVTVKSGPGSNTSVKVEP
jgi:multidrug efflux system membrane fusion protein